jgi:hypothetical protein
MQSSNSQHNCTDDDDLTENGLHSWRNKVPSSVPIRVPTIQQEEPSKIPPNTPDTKRCLRDYTKCRGESFDSVGRSTTPTSLKKVASLSPSPGSDRRSLARSNTYNSLQSAMSGADSQGSTSTRTSDGWTDQVNFLLKIPSTKFKRQRESFGSEDSGRRTNVQELRESLHHRKPRLMKKSLIALRAELQQTTSSSREQQHSARLLLDESNRRHSENDFLGRGNRRKPKKSIIRREIEASMTHSSDECESLDNDLGLKGSTSQNPPRRAISLEALFADMQMETARRADFVRAPSLRTIGSNDEIGKGERSRKDSPPAA